MIPTEISEMETIPYTTNNFGGVIADPESLDRPPDVFEELLSRSLNVWRAQEYKAVWLEVPIEKSDLVPVAIRAGFTYHHAEESYVQLTCRLESGTYIPPHASHYIGVGGVVLNNARELLVVSERYHRNQPDKPWYKLPGGALRSGEHVADGIVREIREETGIRTTFESVVCFRHWHGYRFGKSDIYFVCRLSPLNTDIQMQEEEIADCIWMPVDEYLASDDVWEFNKSIVSAALESPGIVPATLSDNRDPSRFEWFMPQEGP